MSGRLNKERQAKLEPNRMEYAKSKLANLGIKIESETASAIQFLFKGETIILFPYSGWHTGKTIKDGRGIDKLITQLK